MSIPQVVSAIFIAAVFLLSCYFIYASYKFTRSSGAAVRLNLRERPKRIEALEWLKNKNCMLAGNRFRDREAAVDFVLELYKMGATRVVVVLKSSDYADTLDITLPKSSEKRQPLFYTLAREYENESGKKLVDQNQPAVQLSWD